MLTNEQKNTLAMIGGRRSRIKELISDLLAEDGDLEIAERVYLRLLHAAGPPTDEICVLTAVVALKEPETT